MHFINIEFAMQVTPHFQISQMKKKTAVNDFCYLIKLNNMVYFELYIIDILRTTN